MAAGEGEFYFPEPIIQRIQSFLDGKEAARTAIISKSWHSAWLTRPNLDFDETYFFRRSVDPYQHRHVPIGDFNKYAKKTIKRYEQSNLKIESFNLCMQIDQYGRPALANKLIVKALKIGATRLCLRLSRKNSFVLPIEVFGADNLVELSVSGCTIDLDEGVVIKCQRLESLSLDVGVDINFDTVCKLISSCTSIENLSLSGWRFDAAASRATAVGVVDKLIPRLRCLVLSYESFKILCLGDLLSRFPFLKDFTLFLHHTTDIILEEGIQISNSSLERIKFVQQYFERRPRNRKRKLGFKFDVPSARKLTIECNVIPTLSFMSTPLSREWESHVSIQFEERKFNGLSTIWFSELSQLLTELSQSKTHLSLKVGWNKWSFDYNVGDKIIQGLRKHDLENLTIDMTGVPTLGCYALFDGLFRLCRPKLITQYYEDDPHQEQRYNGQNIDFLCQILEKGIKLEVPDPTQFMYGLNDLEEMNVQAYDVDNVPAEWKPISLDSLDTDAPDEHKDAQAKQRIRLLLKWKHS
ncbi:hypothetical protein CASFOL_010217 [Castilleja foliolosa]|uniref:F-box domain-containing protein n=1 Tax=Castilleja foliolosa TaxID=1961234 RepID=A0ABD3DTT7_9LAMI